MSFRITGLDPRPFRSLYGLTDQELLRRGVRRCVADAKPGFPDRVELRDAELGEAVLLLNYVHQPADTPSIRVSGSVLSTRRIAVPAVAEGVPEPETATACT